MKTHNILFSFTMAVCLLTACVSSESEMLKQARSIQNDILNQAESLDSTVNVKLQELNAKRSEMTMDTTMSADSVKLQAYMIVKEKTDNITNLQSELTDWQSNLKMLPTAEEMNSGAENPFGDKVKDQEILLEIKKSQEEFNGLKMKLETAMK